MSDTKQVVATGNPYEAKFGYYRAVRKGPFIVVSGTTSLDPTTSHLLHVGNAKEQAIAAFTEAIKAVLQLDGRKSDVVRVRMFVKNKEDTGRVGEAFREVFGKVERDSECKSVPNAEVAVAAAMVIAEFVDKDMLVEIELDAIVE